MIGIPTVNVGKKITHTLRHSQNVNAQGKQARLRQPRADYGEAMQDK